jgi:hypothetical protein
MKQSKYDFQSLNVGESRSFEMKQSTVSVAVANFKKKNPGFNFRCVKKESGCEVTRIA